MDLRATDASCKNLFFFFFFKSRINCGSPEQNNTELKELTNKSSQNDNPTNVNEHLVVMTVI